MKTHNKGIESFASLIGAMNSNVSRMKMRILILLFLFPGLAMAEDIFVADFNALSKRWAILEDNGNSAWLYLTKSGTQKP